MFSLIKMWSKIITTGLRSHVSTTSFHTALGNSEKLDWGFQSHLGLRLLQNFMQVSHLSIEVD